MKAYLLCGTNASPLLITPDPAYALEQYYGKTIVRSMHVLNDPIGCTENWYKGPKQR